MAIKADVTIKSDVKEFNRLTKAITSSKMSWVDAGFFQAQTKTAKKKKGKNGKEKLGNGQPLTPAQKAAVNEFGVDELNIPSRPFMRNAMRKNDNFAPYMEKLMKEAFKKGKNIKELLPMLGEKARTEIVKSINNSGQFKGNAESTKKQKGSSKPLIDTGETRNNVAYRINIK